MSQTSWWSKASEAQKLAQIRGAIECGMTSRQAAMASRTTVSAISGFTARHDLSFPLKGGSPSQRRYGKVMHDRSAYLRGDRVNLWGNTEAQDEEFALDEVAGS